MEIDVVKENFMVFLGANNHGKSNILRAIEFALTPSMKPDKEHFFVSPSANETTLWVELVFEELTDKEKDIFERYILVNETVKVRKSAELTDDSVEVKYRGYVQEPQEWWLKTNAFERLNTREAIQSEIKNVPELQELINQHPTGKITQNHVQTFQSEYIKNKRVQLTFEEALEDSPLLGKKSVPAGAFPDFYLVPAVRDLSDEIKAKTTTLLGRLLQRAIQEMVAHDNHVMALATQLTSVFQQLNERPAEDIEHVTPSALARLEQEIKGALQDHWKSEIAIELVAPGIEKLFSETLFHVNDGVKTLAERKGHGLQRAVLFALLRAMVSNVRTSSANNTGTPVRNVSESVIFAIEEPEMFLHPHAQRQLSKDLHKIVKAPHHQVFITTHSTHFVDMDQYRSIAIVAKDCPQTGSTIRQCTQELFAGSDTKEKKERFHMAAWINPDRSEMFFAKKVIFVEGETEHTILPYLADKLGVFDPRVSVIDCGSKNNLPLYITIANAFQLKYVLIHDEDPVPPNCSGDKKTSAERTFELNQEIQRKIDPCLGNVRKCSPDFEGMVGISNNKANKKGKAIAALEHFENKQADDIPDELAEIVRHCFAL